MAGKHGLDLCDFAPILFVRSKQADSDDCPSVKENQKQARNCEDDKHTGRAVKAFYEGIIASSSNDPDTGSTIDISRSFTRDLEEKQEISQRGSSKVNHKRKHNEYMDSDQNNLRQKSQEKCSKSTHCRNKTIHDCGEQTVEKEGSRLAKSKQNISTSADSESGDITSHIYLEENTSPKERKLSPKSDNKRKREYYTSESQDSRYYTRGKYKKKDHGESRRSRPSDEEKNVESGKRKLSSSCRNRDCVADRYASRRTLNKGKSKRDKTGRDHDKRNRCMRDKIDFHTVTRSQTGSGSSHGSHQNSTVIKTEEVESTLFPPTENDLLSLIKQERSNCSSNSGFGPSFASGSNAGSVVVKPEAVDIECSTVIKTELNTNSGSRHSLQLPTSEASAEKRSKSIQTIRRHLHSDLDQSVKKTAVHIVQNGEHDLTLEERRFLRHAQEGDVSAVLAAIERQVNINVTDQYGWSALMCACHSGSPTVTELLLRHGADPSLGDTHGNTALHIARTSTAARHRVIALLQGTSEDGDGSDSLTNPEPEGTFHCDVCDSEVSVKGRESHDRSTVHLFNLRLSAGTSGNYLIPPHNRGYRLLMAGGWDGDRGLGVRAQGHRYPVKTTLKQDRRGLGSKPGKAEAGKTAAKVTHFGANDTQAVAPVREMRNSTLSRRKKTKQDAKDRKREINFRREFYMD